MKIKKSIIFYTEKKNFEKIKSVFDLITSSVVFPDQYDSVYDIYNEDFDIYVDKFYRELETYGVFPVRPSNISIKLKNLETNKETTHSHGYSLGHNNDDKIEIVINRRTWEKFNKTMKHYLIFHELAHDVLNLDDLLPNISDEKKIMYPSMSKYNKLDMDDFISNFHSLIENYSSNN